MILPNPNSPDQPESEPKFAPGQLVKHKRYGYRGVIVEFDRTCKADPQWYQKNQTQPQRNQPWYHVLVHASNATTYAAQTSLVADDQQSPILHPLIDLFFEEFDDGWYVRNDEPWPS